ncbi:Wzz/FepE/Etk N-terminal domain-containing protein [Bacillus tianshenii]|nr:Wzz/FepE/Etk N-terminal domain-containing protein [Bacillus tianshenii]
MDIYEALGIIKKNLIRILFTTLLAMIVSGIVSYIFLTPVYQVKTKILVNPPLARGLDYVDVLATQKLMNTYSEIVRSKKIATIVVNRLELNMSPESLISKVKVDVVKESQVITVQITDKDPEFAKVVANELATVFVQEINNIITVKSAEILDEVDLDRKISPAKPKPVFNIIIAGLSSGIVAVGFAIFLRFIDPTATSIHIPRRMIGDTVLGPIPQSAMIYNENSKVLNEGKFNRYMDMMRKIYALLYAIEGDKRRYLISAPHRKMATQKISYDFACSIAETGKKTLLIFFNGSNLKELKLKHIDKKYEFEHELLKNLAYEPAHWEGEVPELKSCLFHTTHKNLSFLGLSKELIDEELFYNHSFFNKMLEDLQAEFNTIVVATSVSMEEVNHSLFLLPFIDSVCLLIEKEHTTKQQIQEAIYQLKKVSEKKLSVYGFFFDVEHHKLSWSDFTIYDKLNSVHRLFKKNRS